MLNAPVSDVLDMLGHADRILFLQPGVDYTYVAAGSFGGSVIANPLAALKALLKSRFTATTKDARAYSSFWGNHLSDGRLRAELAIRPDDTALQSVAKFCGSVRAKVDVTHKKIGFGCYASTGWHEAHYDTRIVYKDLLVQIEGTSVWVAFSRNMQFALVSVRAGPGSYFMQAGKVGRGEVDFRITDDGTVEWFESDPGMYHLAFPATFDGDTADLSSENFLDRVKPATPEGGSAHFFTAVQSETEYQKLLRALTSMARRSAVAPSEAQATIGGVLLPLVQQQTTIKRLNKSPSKRQAKIAAGASPAAAEEEAGEEEAGEEDEEEAVEEDEEEAAEEEELQPLPVVRAVPALDATPSLWSHDLFAGIRRRRTLRHRRAPPLAHRDMGGVRSGCLPVDL